MSEIIFPESNESAQLKTVELWVSRTGRGYDKNNERLARWDGATHIHCESCGNPVEKRYLLCDDCRSKKDIDRYNSMHFKEWDKKTPLVIFETDQYFYDVSDIEEYCEENELNVSDLKLCICEPNKLHDIDPHDHYADLLPEDGDMPEEIVKAFEELNEKIKNLDIVLSWSQGEYRTSINL